MIDPITKWHTRLGDRAPRTTAAAVRLSAPGRDSHTFHVAVPPEAGLDAARYLRTCLHNRVWAVGATEVVLDCGPALFDSVRCAYEPGGEFHHQAEMMAHIFEQPFVIHRGMGEVAARTDETAQAAPGDPKSGRHIGIDLGGSDAKVVVLADGELRHHEKMDWVPKAFTSGEQVVDTVASLARRAQTAGAMAKVDGIGLSTAGIVVDNEVRVSGIFAGLPEDEFQGWVRPLGVHLCERFGGVPAQVAHDGDMTPLWAHVEMGLGQVLGLSLGTGLGAGFVDDLGRPSGMLCELGKVIVDMSPDAPEHIYNHTRGPALHYCSQNAVFRHAAGAGLDLSDEDMLAAQLRRVQELAAEGCAGARDIFAKVGVDLAVAIAEFHGYFDMRHVVLVGRVMAGETGEAVLRAAEALLERELPEVAGRVALHLPGPSPAGAGKWAREFGQAAAAAYWSSMCWGGR